MTEDVTAVESARPAVTGESALSKAKGGGIGVGYMAEPIAPVVGADGCGCGGGGGACSCESRPDAYVYAIGSVTARFPTLNLEKEFMQAWGKNPEQALTISDADKFAVLSQGQNLYLAREMCWVFKSGDIDLYILQPRSYVELTDLVTSLSPTPGQISFALIIGTVGPIAPPSFCNGAQLPIVTCNQVFGFTAQAFINSISAEVSADAQLMRTISDHLNAAGTVPASGGSSAPAPAQPSGTGAGAGSSAPGGAAAMTPAQYVERAARNAFTVLTLLSDNAGQTDEHRAINYLTFKSLALYKKEIEMELNGFTLNSVLAHSDPLSSGRRIQDVILLYASTTGTQVQRYFTRVDVSGQFPFMVNDLAIYYDHP